MLLAVGMAAIVLLGLTSVSALQVAVRQDDRATDIAVMVDPAQAAGDADDLRIVDPRTTNARRWDGYGIRREYYTAGSSQLVAPGVPAMPGPDEFYASPDLVDLMSSDPTVGALFSSERLVGEISPAGLVQPHELRAILGVDAERNLLIKVDGFGGKPAPSVAERDPQTVLNLSVTAYVFALVWIPAAFFVVIISRLAASRREQRAAALHLIGYPRWRIHLLHFVEAASICLPSTIFAGVLHWVSTRGATTLPGTTFGFFSSDAQLSLTTYMVVCAPLLLLVCYAVSSDRRTLGLDRRTRVKPRKNAVPRLGSAALAAGFMLLALPSAASLDGALTPLALWVGIVLSAVGIAVAGPALVMAALAARLEHTTAPRLVGRRMASDRVTTALRLASVLSVIIVLLLGSQSFASVLNGGSAQDWSQRLEAQGKVPVVATDLSGALTLEEVSSLRRMTGATELSSVKADGGFVSVVFSSCERLRVLTGRRDNSDCPATHGPMWLGEAPAADRRHEIGDELTLPSGDRVRVPAPTATLDLPGMPDAFAGALLVSTDVAPQARQTDGATFFLLAPATEVTSVLAALSSLEPTLQLDLGALDRHNPDTQEYPDQVEWLTIGAVVSLLLGFLSLLVVSLGEAQERSPRMRALRVLGASRSQLFTMHFWCVAVPLVLVGFAAIVVGWLAAQAMRNIDDRADIDPQLYGLLALAVGLGGLVVCLVSWRSVTRPSQRAGSFGA
ncbi:hypothetical protein M8330_11450 [Nocardioides sp. BSK12Z-4]|uniref:ABC3 transporter permease C-terminal domain-containing protein n=2 Tax=Nocardioides bruguierae TaxID=2945102 RepID=A0A9X2IGL4_9ACTN|nr:hypothetical protein [Nocardioides bruguierae]